MGAAGLAECASWASWVSLAYRALLLAATILAASHSPLTPRYSLRTTRCTQLTARDSLHMTRYTQLAARLSPREQVALVLVLQWLLYLASTIGSYYKWWVESNQGPGVYTFASTPIEDLGGPIKELQQECTWMDHKMGAGHFAPSSPPANVSGSPSPPESASGELQDAQEQNIMSGAALVRPATAAASTPVGPPPPHPSPPTPHPSPGQGQGLPSHVAAALATHGLGLQLDPLRSRPHGGAPSAR